MKSNLWMWLVIILVVALGVWYWQSDKEPTPQTVGNDMIVVDNLVSGQQVTSPLTVTGEARGPWYFEASFPVELKDANGTTLVVAVADAQSDWMVEDFVPFTVTLNFPTPTTATGSLILHKDNPSGEAINDDSLIVPVTF